MVINDVRVRAKIVLVTSKLDPLDTENERELSQNITSFKFTEKMSKSAYDQLITELKAGSIAPEVGPF
jgi:hypothetical protein